MNVTATVDIDIVTASKENKPGIVRTLIEAGAGIDDQDIGGYTGLHWACQRGHMEVVRVLIKGDADVNIRSFERTECQTSLHLACIFHNARIIRLLLEAGADAGIRNQHQFTAFDYAKRIPMTNSAREEIMDLFREHAPEMVMEAYCVGGPGR